MIDIGKMAYNELVMVKIATWKELYIWICMGEYCIVDVPVP